MACIHICIYIIYTVTIRTLGFRFCVRCTNIRVRFQSSLFFSFFFFYSFRRHRINTIRSKSSVFVRVNWHFGISSEHKDCIPNYLPKINSSISLSVIPLLHVIYVSVIVHRSNKQRRLVVILLYRRLLFYSIV